MNTLLVAETLIFAATVYAQTPQVISVSPGQNELNVAVGAGISATFDIDMDAVTINDSTFLIDGMCTGLHDGVITYDVSSRDLDGDGDPDLANANALHDNVWEPFNNGN